MKKTVLAILALSLVATSGLAQLDPDDDGIGVYFDPCACVNCITMDVGPQRAFLVITHPTSPQGVAGWECKMWMTGPAVMTGIDLQGQEINIGTAPEYIVGTVDPQINPYTYPAIVVAVIDFYILDLSGPVQWWIDGIRFHSLPERVPAYLDGSDIEIIKELKQSTGGRDFPVATVNGDCAVAIEDHSWGDVKALFR
ncbi:hypothetical protein KDM41_10350 [bacterium]|nr:hypothetical protein [bacterium]